MRSQIQVRKVSSVPLRIAALLILFLLPLRPVFGQAEDRLSSEVRLQELRQQLEAEEGRLAVSEKAEEASLKTITKLNRQIGLSEKLVSTYTERLKELSSERERLAGTVDTLDEQLSELKNDYRARARHAYRYGRLHDVALILSAASINEMMVRIRYLHRFSNIREEKLTGVKTTADTLLSRKIALQKMLAENEMLLNEQKQERARLTQLKRSRQSQLSTIRKDQVAIAGNIERKRTNLTELEREVERAISANIARRNGSIRPGNPAAFAALSKAFRKARGTLPWPAAGSIVEPYGEVVNPELGTHTQNPGILIETEPTAEVRSVFDGRVSTIDVNPGFGRYAIIEHGDYYSVYGNFSMFYIAKGQQIKAGQIIGRAGTDGEPKGNAVFFGIYDTGSLVDPTGWLK